MQRIPALTFCLLTIALSTGCATLLRGERQKMKFQTNAPNSTATIDGKPYTLPAEVPLKRNKPHTVVVAAPGFQSIQFDLKSQWDGASLPNIIAPGGSVLFAADTITGADRSFYTLATINLQPSSSASAEPMNMYQFRGRVLDRKDYDRSVKELQEFHREQSYGGTY